MAATLCMTVPYDVVLLQNQTRRLHHHAHAKRVAAIHAHTLTALRATPLPHITQWPVELTLIAHYPTNQRPDHEAICPTLKAMGDALVSARVLPDDTGVFVWESRHRVSQVSTGRGRGGDIDLVLLINPAVIDIPERATA